MGKIIDNSIGKQIKLEKEKISNQITERIDSQKLKIGLLEKAKQENFTEKQTSVSNIINDAIVQTDGKKEEAIQTLDRLVSNASSLRTDATERQKYHVGAELIGEEQHKLVESALKALVDQGDDVGFRSDISRESSPKEAISFVQERLKERFPEAESYSECDIRWADLDTKNMKEIMGLHSTVRPKAYEVWKEFIRLIKTLDDSSYALASHNEWYDNYVFMESVCESYERIYTGERKIVSQRFENLKFLLKSIRLDEGHQINKEFASFFTSKVGKLSLSEIKQLTADTESEIDSRFFKYKADS